MESLKDYSDYAPVIQTLIWICFILFIMIRYRKHIKELLQAVNSRINKGSSLKAFGLELGESKLIVKTSDVKDVKVYGKPDMFQLLFKAETASFKKSTKAMQVEKGCIIQVSTERLSEDGSWVVAEAITFVPNAKVVEDENGNGRYLSY